MIAVISHDAGGAEILSSYVKNQNLEVLYALEGPSRKIFARKLGQVKSSSLADVVRQSTSILCGTSWQSDLEFNAIQLAREQGKPSVAFLDHWVNYQDRFIRSGESCLPDEIWVGDAVAKAMADEIFPDLPVKLVDNPYLQDVRRELSQIPMRITADDDAISVLYVCEPVSEHALNRHGNARFWGYVEEEALQYFLSNLSILNKPVERVVIRPHPSEKAEKYNWAAQDFDLPIEMGGTNSLLEEIAGSDLVAGCESMAMVVALLAERKVISCIPPGGRPCVLPHEEIIRLQDLV